MGFIDTMRAEGYAVESICRVLRAQDCQIAARTYRAWRTRPPAARMITDAQVVDVIRDLAWASRAEGVRRLTPEGLYGRRKMTALLRRRNLPEVSPGAVDRAMRTLGLSGVRRDKGMRTTIPAKDGKRAGDLLDRVFTAGAPNCVWVTDFTYVRTWAGFVYVAFIVDVFAQRIVAWHASTSKATDLVMIPLRMALWERDRQGHPAIPGELIHHSDAGSQGGFNWSSQHLDHGGVWWRLWTGVGRPAMSRRCCDGSGARIVLFDRRCVLRVGLIRRESCNDSFGARSRRASRQRKHR